MRQAIYKTHGNAADVIELVEVDMPDLQPGQTRLKVLRTPINPSDIVQIEGVYGFQPPLPAPAGLEGIGEVVEVNGEGLEPGTLVLLPEPPGAWSTEQIVSSASLFPIPDADIDQLAMLSVNPATAYLLLTQYVELQKGDWIIQSAANSAVGQLLTQLAKARGIRVASVVRRDSAIAEVKEAGADAVFIDGPDLADRVAAELDKAPVLAVDAVAGETFARLTATLQHAGTIVLYGKMSGQDVHMPDAPVLFNDIRMRGFWLTNWMQNAAPEEIGRVYGELTELIVTGQLSAPVDRVFPLDDINEALAYTMKGERPGKVLLAPNGV
ncbi:MAG: zinc-dependent alcohol dehydrogenase family protein [Pseudomonadota bacterium]